MTPSSSAAVRRTKPARSTAAPGAAELRALGAPPRYEFLVASAVFLLVTLALGFPALGGAFLINDRSDQFIGGFPVRNFAAMSLKTGQGIPLWNPYIMGGLPYVAAMHGDIFYPTALLRTILPTDVAMTWSFMIHVFLAALFTFGFLRAWGLSFYPSLAGGVAYMLSGPVAAYVSPGHDGKLFVSALLPLALWMLVRAMRDGRAWSWGALAATIGLAVLSPHPQLLQYLLLTCGAFALWLAFGTIEHGDGSYVQLERRVGLRRLAFALGAVLLGMLMGAVQYLPVREYVAFSPRAGGRGYEYATSFSLPLEETLNFYLPQFSGILRSYWGRNGIHLHSEYLGAATLLLAGLGLKSRRRGFRWFWIATFLVSLLWALGGSTPFYQLIYEIVPGTKFFRAPSTMLYIVGFSAAVLAALGLERALREGVGQRYLIVWGAVAAGVALLASIGGITGVAQMVAYGFAQNQLEGRIASNNGAVVLGAWRCALVVAMAIAILWAYDRRRIGVVAAAAALVAVVAVDLFSVEKQYWMFGPRASVQYASDAAIDHLRALRQPGRVMAMEIAPTPRRDVMLAGDGLMVHDVRQIQGYHGNEPGRFQQVCGATADTPCQIQYLFNPAFWRHENVQYLYTNVGPDTLHAMLASAGFPAFERVVGPVRNAFADSVYLYRLPGDNPYAWLATAFVKAPADQALAAVLDQRFDPARIAVLDTSSRIGAQTLTAAPEPQRGVVEVASYAPGRVTLRLPASPPAGSALVASENYVIGWTATVDGKPAPVDRADFNLIGVQLPANARTVELRYDDPAYETGKVLTILALLAALAMIAGGVLADRRATNRVALADV